MHWVRKRAAWIGGGVILIAATLQFTGTSDRIARFAVDLARTAVEFAQSLIGDDGAEATVRMADRADGRSAGQAARATVSQDNDFEWSGQLRPGDYLEVRGISGDIDAVPASSSRASVTASKRARRSDPSEVRIVVEEHAGGVVLCAVYPSRSGDVGDSCDSDGRRSVRNNDVSVTFEVEVPEGVEFRARTVNGDVRARDLLSEVDVNTVNGSIELESVGAAQAETVNGSIDARLMNRLTGAVHLSTVNGGIDLDLPDDANADIEASWVNGGLSSQLPLTIRGKVSRRAVGVLGAGGPMVRLSTVNGSIEIR